MVLPAQFQLGLELTNIINPISQAMSALGSLAVIDAIKRSGSDFITETKLANLIGRHRIDPVIGFHFRELVARSDQSVISRYFDIILESGSGPTVQEAFKDPALFSMVIQLSGLAFAHENESLANALVEAIEKIVKEADSDVSIVPDYASLLGTLRACQQQTVAFRWVLLYEATEEKVHKVLARPDNQSSKKGEVGFSRPSRPSELYHDLEQSRALPIAVLQGLLMWLQSLQSFPEHRLLHLRCNTGISTIVVWCHHILGLSLILNIRETEVRFGNGPYNIVVDHCRDQMAGVSLMDPLDPCEPLFTLQNDQHSIGMSYDYRAEAYGFGMRLLQFGDIPKCKRRRLAHSVIIRCVKACEEFGTSDTLPYASANPRIDFCPRYPSRTRLLSAGRFLFSLDKDPKIPKTKSNQELHSGVREIDTILVAIVVTFARISEDDLARCKETPLALNVLSSFPVGQFAMFTEIRTDLFLDLLQSFEIMSLLLLGRHLYNDYGKPAVLMSAWGWSVFLDSIDAVDPLDVSVNTMRLMRGVPSRQGFRRTRIIDGPQSLFCSSSSNNHYLQAPTAGISTAEKGAILVGHHNDAFQVTQKFTCRDQQHSSYGFGFRSMAQWAIQSRRLPPCQCYISKNEHQSETKLEAIDRVLEEEGVTLQPFIQPIWENPSPGVPERTFESKGGKISYVYVSDNPAARWLQLGAMHQSWSMKSNDRCVMLASCNTCVDCTIRHSRKWPSQGFYLL